MLCKRGPSCETPRVLQHTHPPLLTSPPPGALSPRVPCKALLRPQSATLVGGESAVDELAHALAPEGDGDGQQADAQQDDADADVDGDWSRGGGPHGQHGGDAV